MDELTLIKSRIKNKGMTQKEFAAACGIADGTLSRILRGHQPLQPNTREKIYSALGLPVSNSFSVDDGVCGFIEYEGRICKVNSYEELLSVTSQIGTKLKVLHVKSAPQTVSDIITLEKLRTCEYEQVWNAQRPLKIEDFDNVEFAEYRTELHRVWSFSRGSDVRDGITLDLGNMTNTFPVKLLGKEFKNTEALYQCAKFQKSDAAAAVQELVANCNNGLRVKRQFIKNKDYEQLQRSDMKENSERPAWCFEWMKFIVSLKVQQNPQFAEVLKQIPVNSIIVENTPHETELVWGCWNSELTTLRKQVDKLMEGKSQKKIRAMQCQINNVGTWRGQNLMGKCLTLAKLCIERGREMPIDIDLLNTAKISWFGRELQFYVSDGKIEVRTV